METIYEGARAVAYVHRDSDWVPGLHFVTPDEAFIQVGTWFYPKGKQLSAHVHKDYERLAHKTQEVAYVKRGSMKVTLYTDARAVLQEIILHTGDLIVITDAGHGYEILEDNTQILEAKNGPFVSVEKDKEKFNVAEAV